MREDIRRLSERLQDCAPGRMQVASFVEGELDREEVARLLSEGRCKTGKDARLKKMRARECHNNSIDLAARNRRTMKFCSGLAHGAEDDPDDDVWRVHSWVEESRTGRINETCGRRNKYFGVCYTFDELREYVERRMS